MARILIVDDSRDNRQFLIKLLGYAGHELLEAGNGEEALRLVRQEKPELVIADILMPVMDGYEFVRRLRADPPIAATKVIFHSAAYEEREVQPLASACGVTMILSKPARPESVLRLVTKALGGSAPKLAPAQHGFDQEHLRLVSNKLAEKAAELEAANLRLATLSELGRRLASEHDSTRLLQAGCQAAREVLAAEYVAAGIANEDGKSLRQLVTAGSDANLAVKVVPEEILAQVLREPSPSALPPDAEHRQLSVRVYSAETVYGFVYAAQGPNQRPFDEEDLRLAATIGAKVGIAYENAHRREELESLNALLEQRVKERTVELSRSNVELEQFAYVASHDLQEPLRKITGFIQLLASQYQGKLDKDADEYIAFVVSGAQRMQALIQDLLAYSRVGRKGKPFAPTDCEKVLGLALENLQGAIEESGALITHGHLPVLVADEGQLVQLLQNLIANAIKFRGSAKPVIHVKAEQRGPEWVFSVKDNGIGIDPQFFERIFVIFQRLHARGEYPGTGIGLAICKKIVERHGGRIWVESQPGQGAAFFFTIPETLPATGGTSP